MSSVLCAFAPSAGALVFWRFVQGAPGGGGIVLARAITADITRGVSTARLFSLFITVSSIAPIVAPILGGLILTPHRQLAPDISSSRGDEWPARGSLVAGDSRGPP
jgi:DHA1 family bicyclomycin/chloramphenicol resistance-like MFS transporter